MYGPRSKQQFLLENVRFSLLGRGLDMKSGQFPGPKSLFTVSLGGVLKLLPTPLFGGTVSQTENCLPYT